MMTLLKVELNRLRWRRAVVVLLAAAVIVPALIWASHAWNTRPLDASDVAAAEAQATRDAGSPWVQKDLARCERRPERFGGPGTTAEQCEEMILPQAENYLWRATLEIDQVRQNEGVAVVAFLAGLLFLIGTTFVGHDWNTGSISNQMLFEPRRLRVWLAKGLGVLGLGLALSVCVLAAFWGATALLAAQRDIVTSDAVWAAALGSGARGVVLAAFAGFLGYATTMLFRSTVATLAMGFAVFAGGSLVVLGVFGEGALRWLMPTNAMAVLLDGFDYYAYTPACEVSQQGMLEEGALDPCMQHLSMQAGSTYLLVVLAVLTALSILFFRRRDLP